MARPLSDEKRLAILNAATETVATHGVGAPTAKIAKLAGVAEGTLFTYFPTKDALLNALYLWLKADLGHALLDDFPADASVIDRSRHVWTRYVGWGAAHPAWRKAIQQLAVSELITPDSRRAAGAGFGMFRDLILTWGGLCNCPARIESQSEFASAVLTAIADTTIDFIARYPARAEEYANDGFEAFWRAVAG